MQRKMAEYANFVAYLIEEKDVPHKLMIEETRSDTEEKPIFIEGLFDAINGVLFIEITNTSKAEEFKFKYALICLRLVLNRIGGRQILTNCESENLKLWNIGTGTFLEEYPFSSPVKIKYVPDNPHLIACITSNIDLIIFDIKQKKLLNY